MLVQLSITFAISFYISNHYKYEQTDQLTEKQIGQLWEGLKEALLCECKYLHHIKHNFRKSSNKSSLCDFVCYGSEDHKLRLSQNVQTNDMPIGWSGALTNLVCNQFRLG